MDQRAFWMLIRRRWMVIVAAGLIGIIVGSVYVLTSKREYNASSELFVATVGSNSPADLAQGSNYSQEQARNYAVVVTREVVLKPVITALGLHTTASALAKQVSASVPLNTSIISISVTDTSPQRAAAIANAVSTSLANVVGELVPKQSDGSSPVRLESVQTAIVPHLPSAPKVRTSLVAGLLGGLVAGIAFVILLELTGAKVRTPEQARLLSGLALLGSVVNDRDAVKGPVVVGSHIGHATPRIEEFRQVRTNLHFLQADTKHKVFVVTSPIPGEGKSTVAANLAAVFAASAKTVCLVEADLRKPSLGTYLDLEGSVGLTTVLAGDATIDEALQSWGQDGLQVLLSGQVPPNPSELLGSRYAERLLTSLRERFDVLIIDCPPILAVTDAAIVAKLFGGAILVVGCGKVQVRELRRAIEALTASSTPILGIITNLAPQSSKERYQREYTREKRPHRIGKRLAASWDRGSRTSPTPVAEPDS